jgi:endonuclease G
MKKIFLLFCFLFISNIVHANILNKILGSGPGGLAVDNAQGKDLSSFEKPNQCVDLYYWGQPKIKDNDVLKRSLYFCYYKFASQYDTKLKVPLWTTEILNKKDLSIQPIDKVFHFQENEKIPSTMQASISDYKKTDFYPAQMAPNIDMVYNNNNLPLKILKNDNEKIMSDSYLLTNTIPQYKEVAPVWNSITEYANLLGKENSKIMVTSGPLYLNGNVVGFLGKSKIAIPPYFFKIITNPNNYGSVAYIIPNSPNICKNGCNVNQFIVSIEEIEKLTGISFYDLLAPYYATQVKQDLTQMYKQQSHE